MRVLHGKTTRTVSVLHGKTTRTVSVLHGKTTRTVSVLHGKTTRNVSVLHGKNYTHCVCTTRKLYMHSACSKCVVVVRVYQRIVHVTVIKIKPAFSNKLLRINPLSHSSYRRQFYLLFLCSTTYRNAIMLGLKHPSH